MTAPSLTNHDPLDLNNQLCFPLYACAKEVVRRYTPLLDELDLTYTQYITMMVLWKEGSMGVKELGDRLYLDSGTLTPLLKKLEAKGYVKRARSTFDERRVMASLTKEGIALRERALGIPAAMAECVPLTPQEAAQFHTLLFKLLDSLKDE